MDSNTSFIEALVDEVMFFGEQLHLEDCQELRRAFCRSVFQFVDGVSSALKTNIFLSESPESIGHDFYLAVQDKRRVLKGGKEKEIFVRNGFARNLSFAFDASGAVMGVARNIKGSNQDWQRFKRCITIRNRVVHPSSLKDLEIKNSDILEMVAMFEWLKNLLVLSFIEDASIHLEQAESLIACFSEAAEG